MQRPYFVVPAPVLFVAIGGIAALLGHLWPMPLPAEIGWWYGGWFLVDVGMVLLLWTAWLMLWRKTTLNPYGKPQQLLCEGPFRVSRNPLYVALLVIYLGVGLLTANLWWLMLFPLLVLLLQFGIVRHEEVLLQKRFGADYSRYCKKVRRWL